MIRHQLQHGYSVGGLSSFGWVYHTAREWHPDHHNLNYYEQQSDKTNRTYLVHFGDAVGSIALEIIERGQTRRENGFASVDAAIEKAYETEGTI